MNDRAPWLAPANQRERVMADTIAGLDSDRASHRRALRRAADLLTGALHAADAGRDIRSTVEIVIDDIMREIR